MYSLKHVGLMVSFDASLRGSVSPLGHQFKERLFDLQSRLMRVNVRVLDKTIPNRDDENRRSRDRHHRVCICRCSCFGSV